MTSKNRPERTTAKAESAFRNFERMIQSIRAHEAALPPSEECVIGLVENLFRCPGAAPLRHLAVVALIQVIARRSTRPGRCRANVGAERSEVNQVECSDPDRGTTLYHHAPTVVTRVAIDEVLDSLANETDKPAHVLFVTTDPIDLTVREYAAGVYQRTGGIEFAILDCLGFVRHFLHLFHRHRGAFLDAYQALVLGEPDSAVSFALKQAFLALRQAATQQPEPDA